MICNKKGGFTLIELLCVLFLMGAVVTLLVTYLPRYRHTLKPAQIKALTQGLVNEAQSLAMTQAGDAGHSYIVVNDPHVLELVYGKDRTSYQQLKYPKNIQVVLDNADDGSVVWEFDAQGQCINPENQLNIHCQSRPGMSLSINPWGVITQSS